MVEREGKTQEQSLVPAKQGFEQKVLQGEVVFSKQLTLRELLGIKPGEEGETKDLLNNAPFDFQVRDIGKSLLHIVSFRKAVSFEQLVPLLKAAKPGGISRVGQEIDGTLADWRIILPEAQETEPRSKELYDFHKKYVPEFSEFEENHFELFWKVLGSLKRREKEARFFNRQLSQFIDEREFFAKYGRQHDFSTDLNIENIVYAHLKSFKSFLEKKGFRIQPNPIRQYVFPGYETLDTYKFFDSMGKQEKRDLAREFYKKSVDEGGIEVERDFGSNLRWDHEGPMVRVTTLIGEGDELNRIGPGGVLEPLDVVIREGPPSLPDRIIGRPDGFKRLDNGEIELTKGESFARISFVKAEDGYKKVKIEDIHLSTAETMIPLIVWEVDKQTGKRSYYCGKFDQFPKHDTLLGQLVVAAYSPKVRDQMPSEIKMIGVDGKEKTQQMLEGQVILLVPRYSNQFLTQGPVILGLEAMV